MPAIRYETSEQLDYEPSKLKRIQHKRAVYACAAKHDEATVITAPKPPEAIERCPAAPGLLARVVVGKFGDYLPGYRMEDIRARGVNLNRSTLYDWMAAVADVTKPLYELMKQLVLQSKIIQTDDTSVKLIDPLADGGSRTARCWAYLGDKDHPFEVYDFRHHADTVREHARCFIPFCYRAEVQFAIALELVASKVSNEATSSSNA